MEHIHLFERLPHHNYRAGWRDEESERHVGTAKVLRARHVGNDDGDGFTYTVRVIVPSESRGIDLTKAIRDTLGTWDSCGHAHDCCACVILRPEVRRVGSREYAVYMRVSYNI